MASRPLNNLDAESGVPAKAKVKDHTQGNNERPVVSKPHQSSPTPSSSPFRLNKFFGRLRSPSKTVPPSPVTQERRHRARSPGSKSVQECRPEHSDQDSSGQQHQHYQQHSRFYSRLLKWLKSKTGYRRGGRSRHGTCRRQSTEMHASIRYKVHQKSNADDPAPGQTPLVQLHPHCGMRQGSLASTGGRRSIGDITAMSFTSSSASSSASSRRHSELSNKISCPNSSSSRNNLVPPGTTCNGSLIHRDMSMESGYQSQWQSHSSLSTPSTPRLWLPRRRGSRNPPTGPKQPQPYSSAHYHHQLAHEGPRQPPKLSTMKSVSVDAATANASAPAGESSHTRQLLTWRSEDHTSREHNDNIALADATTQPLPTTQQEQGSSAALEKRRQFSQLRNGFFQEAVVEDAVEIEDQVSRELSNTSLMSFSEDDVESSMGEWHIPHEEVTFGKQIVHGGSFGHDVFAGKWHGDVVIHSFSDLKNWMVHVRQLTQIRHESIVLYMGSSVWQQGRTYNIITNPVKAQSLHTWLQKKKGGQNDDVDQMLAVAKQLSNAIGYLHAKDIVHGRISSRNVFLDRKVLLSLLDYAVGCSNTVYSSPQILSKRANPGQRRIFRGTEKSDDVFAFGTLLFELFSAHLPMTGDPESVVEATIQSGRLPCVLGTLPCTEKLKKLIQRCWHFEACQRPTFDRMVLHFEPGNCLLRRHSTSEPRLDQLSTKARAKGSQPR